MGLLEYRELQQNSTGSNEPEHMFCLGYVFGAGFGLALSTVRPDLVRSFEPQFRARGWLAEHGDPGPNSDGGNGGQSAR